MVRTYKQKNPYIKNSRLTAEQTHQLILMYLKGVKISQCAKFLGVSKASMTKTYKRLDEIIRWDLFFLDFTRFLDDRDEDGLVYLLHTIRGMICNMRRGGTKPEEDWELDTVEYTPHIAYLWGYGDYYPTHKQIYGCAFHCESDTPPLAVKQSIENGCIDEVMRKRVACKNCPLKFKEIYIPNGNRTKYFCKEEDGRSLVFEPNTNYQNDWRELMESWVAILWFLGHFRNINENNLALKIIHGSYFSALKKGEYKVSNNVVGGVGYTIPMPLLFPEQKEEIEKGFHYVSTLDAGAVNGILKQLAEN